MRVQIGFGIAVLCLQACQARPDRPDPLDFPSALDDTAALPVANDCTTLAFPFEVNATGYVANAYDGVASYEYKSIPDERTSVVMRACGRQPLPVIMTLNYYGSGRVRKGTYDVSRLAKEDGEFEFAFVNEDLSLATNCSDDPQGSVTITKSNFSVLEGRFDITARCFDGTILNEGRRPQNTRFVGSFSATNTGQE